MFLNSRKLTTAAALMLFLPVLGFSTAISVNGSCAVGSCASVDVLQADGYLQGDLDTVFTFGNGDSYRLTGHYGALNTLATSNPSDYGPDLNVNVTATYLGASPSVGRDVLSINFLQNYSLTGFASSDLEGTYTSRTDATVLKAGVGSTFQAQELLNGVSLGLMGPFTEGINAGSGEAYLSNFVDPTTAQFQFIYTFETGSDPGALISSLALPEPGYGIVFGLLLVAAGTWKLRQRKAAASI